MAIDDESGPALSEVTGKSINSPCQKARNARTFRKIELVPIETQLRPFCVSVPDRSRVLRPTMTPSAVSAVTPRHKVCPLPNQQPQPPTITNSHNQQSQPPTTTIDHYQQSQSPITITQHDHLNSQIGWGELTVSSLETDAGLSIYHHQKARNSRKFLNFEFVSCKEQSLLLRVPAPGRLVTTSPLSFTSSTPTSSQVPFRHNGCPFHYQHPSSTPTLTININIINNHKP